MSDNPYASPKTPPAPKPYPWRAYIGAAWAGFCASGVALTLVGTLVILALTVPWPQLLDRPDLSAYQMMLRSRLVLAGCAVLVLLAGACAFLAKLRQLEQASGGGPEAAGDG